MLIAKKISKIFSQVLEYINAARQIIIHYQEYAYQIEKVDLISRKVVLRSRVARTVLKTSFEDAIGNANIIFRLSPLHACLLGGYYGRALRIALVGKEALIKVKKVSFLLTDRPSIYKIVFQKRDGYIGYINKKTNEEFLEHPVNLALNKSIISGFDSSQACYIGMLAGINIEKYQSLDSEQKHQKSISWLNKPVKLRLVK